MEIVRRELSAKDIAPENVRYNPTTDTVEITVDGGETWTPSPENDPRTSTQWPPRITANTECDAAAAMVAHMQEILNQVILGVTGGAAAVATSIVMLFFPGAAVILAVIAVIVGYLIGLGVEDLTTMAESSDWFTLQCILNCRLNMDGQLTQAAFDDAIAAVNTDIGGTNATIIGYLMQMAGFGGLNYAASVREETGDCGACDDCEWTYDITPDMTDKWVWLFDNMRSCNGTNLLNPAQWGFVQDNRWYPTIRPNDFPAIQFAADIDIPADSQVTRVEFHYVQTSGGNLDNTYKQSNYNAFRKCYDGAFAATLFNWYEFSPALSGIHLHMDIRMVTGGQSIRYYFDYIRITGTGRNPRFA